MKTRKQLGKVKLSLTEYEIAVIREAVFDLRVSDEYTMKARITADKLYHKLGDILVELENE